MGATTIEQSSADETARRMMERIQDVQAEYPRPFGMTDPQTGLWDYLVHFASMRTRLPGHFYNSVEELMLAQGTFYAARLRPTAYRAMTRKQCFRNAMHLAMMHADLTYVEGIALCTVVPLQHAWCVDAEGAVIDPTWRFTKASIGGVAYIGLPVERRLLAHAVHAQGHYGVLNDWKNHYPALVNRTFTTDNVLAAYRAEAMRRKEAG